MKNVARIIPCYAADTAGVCSALYELGGMTVVHDASGCNSTYATHDEPRWVEMQSMIYISALTELDAIMGDDEKFIADVTAAAHDQQPAFITICGSPMPMMTGFDFDAAAAEIEARTGIRTLAMHTNGTRSYVEGASEAFGAIVREYVKDQPKADGIGVNILGATPLDFGISGAVESIRQWLADCGFTVISCLAMGDSLADIARAAAARVNLVISASGLAAAQYLKETFGIPYVCGVPVGAFFSGILANALRLAVQKDTDLKPCIHRGFRGRKVAVIGDAVYAGSLAAALISCDARVICPLPDGGLLPEDTFNSHAAAEEDIEAVLAAWQPEFVLADPLYQAILPAGAKLIPFPHYAFSGRCFDKAIPDWTAEKFDACGIKKQIMNGETL